MPVLVEYLLAQVPERSSVPLFLSLLHQTSTQVFNGFLAELAQDRPLVESLGLIVPAFRDDGSCELVDGREILRLLMFLESFFFFALKQFVDMIEVHFADDSEGVELSRVPGELVILEGDIEVEHFPSELVFEVGIGHYHEVDGVEVLGLPLDVAGVGGPQEVLLLLVVEDQSIVLVLQHPDVLVQHKVYQIELAVGQSKEIFELDGDAAGRHPQHIVALQKLVCKLQTGSEGQLANVTPQMHHSVKNQEFEVFLPLVLLLHQLPVQDLHHVPTPALHGLGTRKVHLERDPDVDHERLEGIMPSSTDEVTLRFERGLRGSLSQKIGSGDFGHHEQVPHSIAFLADQIGRYSVFREREYLIAGLFGDGDGVPSEEHLAFLVDGEEIAELGEDVRRERSDSARVLRIQRFVYVGVTTFGYL